MAAPDANIICGQILVFLDAYVLNKPEVMIGQVMQKIDTAANAITDEPTRIS